jgi:hypothetical protein
MNRIDGLSRIKKGKFYPVHPLILVQEKSLSPRAGLLIFIIATLNKGDSSTGEMYLFDQWK